MSTPHDLSYTVERDTLSDKPLRVKIEATAEDRGVLASRFDLLEVGCLRAALEVTWRSAEKGVLVEGRIEADIVQRCVATLDPVPDHIDESFDLLLVDEETAAQWDEQELYLEPEHRDYDAFEGSEVPLGEIVAQTLSILMNDFPRADGVDIDVEGEGVEIDGPERTNPFAALQSLKDKA